MAERRRANQVFPSRSIGKGILSGPLDGPWRARTTYPEVEATSGMVVTHLGSRFTGKVRRVEGDAVVLRSDNTGLERLFTLRRGSFSLAGETVTLTKPAARRADEGQGRRTASGSVAVRAPARVARPSRILVEGAHDAELVEKVWGDDLRVEGVVVERLDGIDVLAEVLVDLTPSAETRIGVLVDHMVPGSKEQRIATRLEGPYVRIAGTPFVDVWQAIRPSVVGIDAWPVIPPGQPWKAGICAALGEADPGRLWRKLLAKVDSYTDLEPSLVGAVESLIDFVTVGS